MTLDEQNDEVNKALESRFSQLNAALESHEARLKSMMIPRDTWVKYDSWSNEDYQSGHALGETEFLIGMIKLRGAWRLCHAAHYENYCGLSDDIDWKPITEASIENRIKAAEHIDKLRKEIVQAKEKLIPEVENAIARLVKSLE